MLFFTRAALCIGTIVVLAEGLGPADLITGSRDAAGSLARAGAKPLADLCRTRPAECLAAIGAVQDGTDPISTSPPAPVGNGGTIRRTAAKATDLSLRGPVHR